jgi:2-isopropylmalate synthase
MVDRLFDDTSTPQASRELASLRQSGDYVAPFQTIRRRVIDDLHEGRMTIDAMVVVRVDEAEETGAASGVGVVNALDLALRKALLKHFPFLDSVHVVETYIHGSGDSTEAEMVSVKKFGDGKRLWTTLAKSADTIEAAWQSLVDGYEWRIYDERRRYLR